MIKHIVILATVAVMVYGQRPPYAGSSNRHYPQVLPQYRPASLNAVNDGDATTAIVPRVGGEAEGITSTPQPVTYHPFDPFNDQVLLDTIKSWPREKQPFWYVNRQQIQEHNGGNVRSTSSTPGSVTGSQ